ncbi:MAG: hypothetical protein U9P38_04135 [Campylobacterota bacterium]|nr:hypothetical protein [Campylobacterota bacterium]
MDIGTDIESFFALVQSSNFNFAEVYAQSPMGVYMFFGVLLAVIVVVFLMKRALTRASAMRTLSNIDNPENSFSDYDLYMQKIAKVFSAATPEFHEILNSNKRSYYKAQLKLLETLEIDDKIVKYQQMSDTYMLLSEATSADEDLSLYFSNLSTEIITEKLHSEIGDYAKELEFNEESLSSIESIVRYANSLEDPEVVLSKLKSRLQNIDFGSGLDIFMFVRSLNSETLLQVYDFCTKRQNELFENSRAIISSEILDYLLENGEKEKVYNYIKSLTLATYLQELNYKYFNQRDSLEFDLIFIANKTEINSDYKTYLEVLLSDNWRNDTYLEILVGSENVSNVIGHLQNRQVIERVDRIRKEVVEKQILDEALHTARQAEIIALEAKNIADGNLSKAQAEALEKAKSITMSQAKENAQQLENELKKNEDEKQDDIKSEDDSVTVEVKKEVEQIAYTDAKEK